MGMTLGNFDFSFQPSMEKRRIETLSTCAFIRQRETVLIQGPPGTGCVSFQSKLNMDSGAI
jgi:DNA replication protein DnaC